MSATVAPPSRAGGRARAVRLVGVDVARCLALLGMMATHTVDLYDPTTFETGWPAQLAGRSSALFAVLAGVSLALTSGRTTPLRGRPLAAAAAGVAVRAVLVAAVGLALAELDSGVAVILTYYGVLFLLAIPFLGLRARPLLVLAGVWLVLAPVVSQLLRAAMAEPALTSPTVDRFSEPGALLGELLLTGSYPAVPWLGYVLLGLALGRCDLRRWSAPGLLVTVGGAVAILAVVVSDLLLATATAREVVGSGFVTPEQARLTLETGLYGTTPTWSWWWLVIHAPHSGTPFDLLHTAGTSCVVLGLGLLLGRVLPGVCRVGFGAGTMTLSLYSLHVAWLGLLEPPKGAGTWLEQVVVVLAIGAVFSLVRRRGPLETVVGVVADRVRRTVAGRGPSGVPVEGGGG